METLISTQGIAEEIQLSVAPVFLLTAIAGLLGVLTQRLNRAIDRSRTLTEGGADAVIDAPPGALALVARRVSLIRWAMVSHIAAGALICLIVALIFLGDYVRPNLSPLIAALFVAAMTLILSGLLLLLTEVVQTVRGQAQSQPG